MSALSQLSLEEKVSLLSGSSFVAATGIPRLGLPPIKLLDSVNGVKGSSHINGLPTLCFPNTACLGATWNPSLIKLMGAELAAQANHKGVSVVLGPTVNIQRDPRGGRNFESFSEDPLLCGRLAAALINGMQENGIAACPKHFVGNESETRRRLLDLKESWGGRTMREIYLSAFQTLLRESTPMAIMTAYNKIDGVLCSESPIIWKVLREEWGFNGLVMSDWFGTRSGLQALNAGLDLEMPGPSAFRGKAIVKAVQEGLIDERLVDESAARVLSLVQRTSGAYSKEEQSVVNKEANALARRIATEGMVLLKNKDNILPLKSAHSPKIALFGPFAVKPPISGGGSGQASPQHHTSPLEYLRSSVPNVEYSEGIKIHTTIPPLPLSQTRASNSEPGIDIAYFVHSSHEPVLIETISSTRTAMLGSLKPPLTAENFSHFTISTTLTPLTTGLHTIGIQSTASFTLSINDSQILSDPMTPNPSVEDFLFVPLALQRSATLPMTAGKSYTITAKIQSYTPSPSHGPGEPSPHAAALCFLEEYDATALLSSAVSLAQKSDLSIIFAGRNETMESEGFDLPSLFLPSNQESLISSVAQASRKTILVLYAGNPIDVSPYVDLVDAILLAHFPGQEGAQAVIDLLLGRENPSGKLAVTWPRRLEDAPSFSHFPATESEEGKWEMRCGEGLRVGYRDYGEGREPRWKFGFGLSYTRFYFSGLSCEIVGGGQEGVLEVEVDVRNIGEVEGAEVVQVYVSDIEVGVWRPKEELKGFEKVFLKPGEEKSVKVTVGLGVAFSFWDEGEGCWRAEKGTFEIRVGEMVENVVLHEGFTWCGL